MQGYSFRLLFGKLPILTFSLDFYPCVVGHPTVSICIFIHRILTCLHDTKRPGARKLHRNAENCVHSLANMNASGIYKTVTSLSHFTIPTFNSTQQYQQRSRLARPLFARWGINELICITIMNIGKRLAPLHCRNLLMLSSCNLNNCIALKCQRRHIAVVFAVIKIVLFSTSITFWIGISYLLWDIWKNWLPVLFVLRIVFPKQAAENFMCFGKIRFSGFILRRKKFIAENSLVHFYVIQKQFPMHVVNTRWK